MTPIEIADQLELPAAGFSSTYRRVLMYLSPLDAQIMLGLRHGPLDHYQLAEDVRSAPFVVRAELKRLKRDRRVRELLDARGHRWELTGRGQREAEDLARDQLEFEVA